MLLNNTAWISVFCVFALNCENKTSFERNWHKMGFCGQTISSNAVNKGLNHSSTFQVPWVGACLPLRLVMSDALLLHLGERVIQIGSVLLVPYNERGIACPFSSPLLPPENTPKDYSRFWIIKSCLLERSKNSDKLPKWHLSEINHWGEY